MKRTKSYVKEIKSLFPKFEIEENNGKFNITSDESNFDYYVDTNKGIITATLLECRNVNKEANNQLLHAYTTITRDHNSSLYKRAKKYSETIITEYRGKAKCHDEDVFDLAFGIKLARDRAIEKFEQDEIVRTAIARWMLSQIERKLAMKQLSHIDAKYHRNDIINKALHSVYSEEYS